MSDGEYVGKFADFLKRRKRTNSSKCRLILLTLPVIISALFGNFVQFYRVKILAVYCPQIFPSRYYLSILGLEISLLSDILRWTPATLFWNDTRCSKKKAVPLQSWSGPEGSRKLRFPNFVTTAQDGGKVVIPTHRPPLSPGNNPGTHFC